MGVVRAAGGGLLAPADLGTVVCPGLRGLGVQAPPTHMGSAASGLSPDPFVSVESGFRGGSGRGWPCVLRACCAPTPSARVCAQCEVGAPREPQLCPIHRHLRLQNRFLKRQCAADREEEGKNQVTFHSLLFPSKRCLLGKLSHTPKSALGRSGALGGCPFVASASHPLGLPDARAAAAHLQGVLRRGEAWREQRGPSPWRRLAAELPLRNPRSLTHSTPGGRASVVTATFPERRGDKSREGKGRPGSHSRARQSQCWTQLHSGPARGQLSAVGHRGCWGQGRGLACPAGCRGQPMARCEGQRHSRPVAP